MKQRKRYFTIDQFFKIQLIYQMKPSIVGEKISEINGYITHGFTQKILKKIDY